MKHFLAAILGASAMAAEPLAWKQLPPLPDPLGVAGAYAGVSNGALLVAGGANFPDQMPWEGGKKQWVDTVWVLESPEGAWQKAGRLPGRLAYGVSARVGEAIFCAGGSDAERHHAEVFRVAWRNGKLETEAWPPLPIPLASACGVVVGRQFIVACGAEAPGEQAASNRAFAIDLVAVVPKWRELPPLPGKARILPVAATWEDRLFVFGGAALEKNGEGKVRREYLRDAWSYHAEQGWKRLADLPKPCAAAPSPAARVDGKLLLIAGDDGSRVDFQPIDKHPGFPAQILAYDPERDAWSEAGATPAPRATTPCVSWRGVHVIPSGEARPGVRSPEVWSLR